MEEVFILGTGESLLELTEEEKKHINNSNSIAVNSFLIFHSLIGIIPKSWIYIDLDNKTKTILKHTCEFADKLNIDWYLGQEHLEIIDNLGLKPKSKITKINVKNYGANRWSKSLTDNFFWSSVIGYTINLICVLFPNTIIKILGMDGIGQYFYTKELYNYNQDIIKFHSKQYLNPNVDYHNSVSWVHGVIPYIKNKVKEHGCEIYVSNKDSIFVGENQSFYDDKTIYKPKEFFEYKSIIS